MTSTNAEPSEQTQIFVKEQVFGTDPWCKNKTNMKNNEWPHVWLTYNRAPLVLACTWLQEVIWQRKIATYSKIGLSKSLGFKILKNTK